MSTNFENSAMTIGLEKFIPIPKKGNTKDVQTNVQLLICTISHAIKVMLKILQARFQQYVN